jgi:hypothetical protein
MARFPDGRANRLTHMAVLFKEARVKELRRQGVI